MPSSISSTFGLPWLFEPHLMFFLRSFWRSRDSYFTERQLTYRRLSIPIAVTVTQSLTDCHCHYQEKLGPLGPEQTFVCLWPFLLGGSSQGTPLTDTLLCSITLNRRASLEMANFTGPFPHPCWEPILLFPSASMLNISELPCPHQAWILAKTHSKKEEIHGNSSSMLKLIFLMG